MRLSPAALALPLPRNTASPAVAISIDLLTCISELYVSLCSSLVAGSTPLIQCILSNASRNSGVKLNGRGPLIDFLHHIALLHYWLFLLPMHFITPHFSINGYILLLMHFISQFLLCYSRLCFNLSFGWCFGHLSGLAFFLLFRLIGICVVHPPFYHCFT